MSHVQSGDPDGLSSWTVIDPNEAATVQTSQDNNNVNDDNEPVEKTENPQAFTTPPTLRANEKPKENEAGTLLPTLSQVESFVIKEHEQPAPSYTKETPTYASLESEETREEELGQERNGGGGGGSDAGGNCGGGSNSGDEDSDIVTLDPNVVEEVGPELPLPSGNAAVTPSHEFVRITPMPDTTKVWEASSSDDNASPEVPAMLRHRRPSKRKSPRGERRVSANPAAQTSISLHGCIICVACVVIALAALKKFMAGDAQVGIASPDLNEVAGDLNSLGVAAPALPETKIREVISPLVEDKGEDGGTSLFNGCQTRQMDSVAALENVGASCRTEEQKVVDLNGLLTELQQLSNKVDNLKITAVEVPVTTAEGDGGIVDSDTEIKRRILAELGALADRLHRRFGVVLSKQGETAQQSEHFHLQESLSDEFKESHHETTIITHVGDVNEMEKQNNEIDRESSRFGVVLSKQGEIAQQSEHFHLQESLSDEFKESHHETAIITHVGDVNEMEKQNNEIDRESINDPPSESGGSGIIVEPIKNVDESVVKERTHREVPLEKQQKPGLGAKSPKKHVPKIPKDKSGQKGGTFDKLKTSAKAFFQTQKERFNRAKETIGNKFQKISDSFKSTFKRWKEKSKNVFKPKILQDNDARSHKFTAPVNEPSNVKKYKDKSKYKNERTAEETKNDAKPRPTVARHHSSPGSQGGKYDAKKTNGRKTPGAGRASKRQDIVSATEMLQILRRYLEQIGNFHHWKDLESFLDQFYRGGKFLRDQMSLEELVENVQNYLEVLGYGEKVKALRNTLRDYVKQRVPVRHKAPRHVPDSQ